MTSLPDLNTAVFTTTFVVKQGAAILYVAHDTDGDWQFFSADGAVVEEVMLVSINELLAIDATLQEVLDLPLGFVAHRSAMGDSWHRTSVDSLA